MIVGGAKMGFSSIVKKVRLELSLTQKQLAQALNVSYTTINRWENGHVVPSNLAQKSFFDFCESNFINASQLLKQDGNE